MSLKRKTNPSSISHTPSRLALNIAITTALITGYGGRNAYAGTCSGVAGTYTCSGPASPADITQQLNGSNLTVNTSPGFGIDTTLTGDEAFRLYAPAGAGNVIFTDTNSSIITGNGAAIDVGNYNDGYISIFANGTLTSNTRDGISIYQSNSATNVQVSAEGAINADDSGISINNYGSGYADVYSSGPITATNNQGIRVRNDLAASNITISSQNDVSGNGGIYAGNYGSGTTTITATGIVDGGGDEGISVNNYNTASSVTITANTVTANDEGIRATNYGYGGVQVTANGDVSSTIRNAIDIYNNGSGPINITTRGLVTANNGVGINAYASTGSTGVTINAEANINAEDPAINAINFGLFNTDINITNASLVSTNSDAVEVRAYADSNTLSIDAINSTISGQTNGIYARNYGSGPTTVYTTGSVTGTAGEGIRAISENTSSGLSVTTQSTVSGNQNGINAQNYGTGNTDLTLSGPVVSTGMFSSAINVYNELSTGNATVITQSTVTSQNNGINVYSYGSGVTSVDASGYITATAGAGIIATNGSSSTGLAVTANGGINSFDEGIRARNYANTNSTVTVSNGSVISNDNTAIEMSNYNYVSDLTLNAYGTGAISGRVNGIYTRNYNGGSISITANGPVSATSFVGISAINDYLGLNMSINTLSAVNARFQGIRAQHYGTGTLSVFAQGDVSSTNSDAVFAYNGGSNTSTVTTQGTVTSDTDRGVYAYSSGNSGLLDMQIQGDVNAAREGVFARHSGVSNSQITISSATITSTNSHGIYAYQDSNAGQLTITSNGSITGQDNGIMATSIAPNNITINASGLVQGQTQYGIYSTTNTGVLSIINLNSGANVLGGIYNNDGNSISVVTTGASISGPINLGDGNDIITFSGGDFSTVSVFDGGDDALSGDGSTDSLSFQGSSGLLSGGALINWENINISLTSNIQFDGVDSFMTEEFDLLNTGVLTLQDGVTDDNLTINANFNGGGSLNLDTTLGDENSTSDVLIVNGDTSGTTTVNINNVGGAGAITAAPGILVVDVNGASNGLFELAAPINVNGYEYDLVAVGGDYYLQGDATDADLSVNKELLSSGPFFVGDTVTYEITVTNDGPLDATNVVVSDVFTNLTLASVTGGSCAPASFPCTIANLADGASETLTVTATIDAAGAFDNSASVSSDQPDANSANNTDNTGNGGTAIGRYFIGGSVSGLLSGNYMLLQNNDGDDAIIMNNGAFVFNTPLDDGSNYNVTIEMQPDDPIQPCMVANGSGTLAGVDVTDVSISCEPGNDLIFRDGFSAPPPPRFIEEN